MMLNDKQKEEVNKEIYQQVQENLDDLTVFEDYWHGMTCSDGTVLDINIYDGFVYGGEEKLQCTVYKVDKELNVDYSNPIWFESEHLDGIDPNTNAQQMYGDIF
jgi:hypothetical protein